MKRFVVFTSHGKLIAFNRGRIQVVKWPKAGEEGTWIGFDAKQWIRVREPFDVVVAALNDEAATEVEELEPTGALEAAVRNIVQPNGRRQRDAEWTQEIRQVMQQLKRPLAVKDLAEETDLPKGVVLRLLQDMENKRMVRETTGHMRCRTWELVPAPQTTTPPRG